MGENYHPVHGFLPKGVNLLVQQGNNLCPRGNGVIVGYMAEWVEMEFLGPEKN
jgi:hypothetical protein